MSENEVLEKYIIEVVKHADSDRTAIAYLQENHGQDWTHVDVNARNAFKRITESMLKCVARMSILSKRIQMIKRNSKKQLLWTDRDLWEYVFSHEKNKANRKEWLFKFELKLHRTKMYRTQIKEKETQQNKWLMMWRSNFRMRHVFMLIKKH